MQKKCTNTNEKFKKNTHTYYEVMTRQQNSSILIFFSQKLFVSVCCLFVDRNSEFKKIKHLIKLSITKNT